MITIGLDVGGTKVLGVAVDDAAPGTVIAEERMSTPDGGKGLVDVLAGLFATLAAETGEVRGVGVGVPGLVDRDGVLHMGPHLHHLTEVPLAREVAAAVGVPAIVDNDANCHAVAEQRAGAAAGADDALVVTLGTGIGAGIVIDGQLLRGAHGFAGEAGHMVVDPTGPPCPCGKRGCWERMASGTGLARLARDAAEGGRLDAVLELAGGDHADVRGEHVSLAARQGDAAALEVIDQLGWWVALGLANLANILDPAMIVIGGGLVEAADLLLPPVRAHFQELVMAGDQRPETPIVPAQHGERAGAIGAALLSQAPAAASA